MTRSPITRLATALLFAAALALGATGCNTVRGAGDAAAAAAQGAGNAAQSVTHGIVDDAEAVTSSVKNSDQPPQQQSQ